ncbi:interferon-inducible GTPase 1-like [Ruditapes philippinarum]|uniref:interferon-inducible GTPase 1-like n=1 Tax=Ruditapes philippinarum TaxID=129788 RepID=UPI00295ADA6D|nr:interferon-inducible GTPase 1-like [Ruditapes philippinarum]XP_060591576.1 interferon-inducible GTPase 1-like [Ruditapes philippinarum]
MAFAASDEFVGLALDTELQKGVIEEQQQREPTKINIGVTGPTKSGKSSVINRLRNVSSTEEGAAEVDNTKTDSSTDDYKYSHNQNTDILLWELPDQKGKEFDRYDFFLVLSEKNFFESDKWYINKILETERPCFFVCTCVGRGFSKTNSAALKHKTCKDTLEKTRASCKRNLECCGIKNPTVFLVDTDDAKNSFEFEALQDKLLPMVESTKIGEIPFSFDWTQTGKIMNSKKELLEKRILEKGKQASKAKTVDERKKILQEEVMFQQQLFGIDEDNLKTIETMYKLPEDLNKRYGIEFDTRAGDSEKNVIRFAKVDDGRLERSASLRIRRASNFVVGMIRGEVMTNLCKRCMKILEESLKMVFDLRDQLNKEVMTHLAAQNENKGSNMC